MKREDSLKELIAYVDALGLIGRAIFGKAPNLPSSPDLSRLELILVASLRRLGRPITLKETARRLACSKQQASRLVDKLVTAGYLKKKAVGRTIEITLSDLGEKKYETIEQTRIERMEKALKEMSDDKLAEAVSSLHRLRDLFTPDSKG